VSKTWFLCLAILSAVLAVVSVTLAIILFRQQRFVPVNGSNPYIMFDNRTAQACWSGPPIKPTPDAFDQKFGLTPVPMNPNDLPSCKDLK